MTPQSQFMVIAPVAAGRETGLRNLLGTMNSQPGLADPSNPLVPFGRFDRLHFARWVILADDTMVDLTACGFPRPNFPTYLAFMGVCDGSERDFLADLCSRAGDGLRKVFAHCEGFTTGTDVLSWMLAHNLRPSASYVNWVGRTARQIREENALQRALSSKVPRTAATSGNEAQRIRRELITFIEAEVHAGRLMLTHAETTPIGWQIANAFHLIAVPLIGLLALPLLIVLSPALIFQLRTRERSDPEICPRPRTESLQGLQQLEDRDVTNQFTALGAVKPGLFRRWLVSVLLVLIDYACRHIFSRGHLARVQTIHFARWVFIDNRARVVFASNYDGSHEAYMDDFINKVAWGLNLVFSNGVGWPHTDWLILRGARREQQFKYYQRRHQLPTQVWYKAYPGLTLTDLARNQRIRQGLERSRVTDAEALAWVRLL